MIDGHAHACGDLLTAEGIVRALDAQGVDKVVLVPGQHQSYAPTYFLVISLLFLLKVLFAFAVDHYAQAPTG